VRPSFFKGYLIEKNGDLLGIICKQWQMIAMKSIAFMQDRGTVKTLNEIFVKIRWVLLLLLCIHEFKEKESNYAPGIDIISF
jgi:hypothetical protein